MEMHNKFNCYVSIDPKGPSCGEGGVIKFFDKNHFLIAHNMFDLDWDEKTKLEEIVKKLVLICDFDLNDKNIAIVHKRHKRVYLPNGHYVPIPPRGIFVYNKLKLEVFY